VKNESKRFVFIGCGKIAYYHADVIVAYGHQIIGVAARHNSHNITQFSEKYGIKNCYDDFNKMLKELEPEAIILCTTWDQTENIITEIINWGIPVLAEKPVALTSEKILEILEETKNLSENVLVGYNRRFYDFIPILKQTIIGQTLRSVQLTLPESFTPLLKSNSDFFKDHFLVYMSSHWLDLIIFLLGDIELLTMHSQTDKEHPVSYHGLLKTISGNIPIHYQSDFDTPQQTSINFVFNSSVWKLCPVEILSIYEGLERIEPTKDYPIRRYMPKLLRKVQTNKQFKPGFYNQMGFFIRHFLNDEPKNDLGCTLKDTLKVTKLCEDIKNKK